MLSFRVGLLLRKAVGVHRYRILWNLTLTIVCVNPVWSRESVSRLINCSMILILEKQHVRISQDIKPHNSLRELIFTLSLVGMSLQSGITSKEAIAATVVAGIALIVAGVSANYCLPMSCMKLSTISRDAAPGLIVPCSI